MGHLCLASMEAFLAVFLANATTLAEDIANYTNVQPTMQISEVKI